LKLETQLRYEHFCISHRKSIAQILALIHRNSLYIPCLEVPITTYCSLRCRNCANLIQYYERPYHVDCDVIIKSVQAICYAVERVDCLRILGGEPFLYPELDKILYEINNMQKVANIVIVTNGTMMLPERVARVIGANKKFKVSISEYCCVETERLSQQLDNYDVYYEIRNIPWKEKASVLYRNYSEKELAYYFKNCPNRFFSLLNGQLHLCPRSAHGNDLGFFRSEPTDFINVLQIPHDEIRTELRRFLRVPRIVACNYCDEPLAQCLKTVVAGEQVGKDEMMKKRRKMMEYNHARRGGL